MRRQLVALVLAWVGASTPAGADHASYHLTANGDAAATDNVFAADTGRQADLFFQLRPGVLFAYDAPRMIHDLSAEVELLEYTVHSSSPSVTYRAAWRGFFLPGPRSDVIVSADASTGILTALTASTPSNETTAAVVPGGAIDVRQGNASQSLSYLAGKATRILQNLLARYARTDDRAGNVVTSSQAGATLGFEYQFRNDTLAIEGGVTLLHLERLAPPGALLGNRLDQQVNPLASAQWRHDITKQWSASADGGVVFVRPVGTDPYNPTDVNRKTGTFPVGGVEVAYADVWGRATLAARHAVSPNLFIAQNTVDTGVTAQLALPLPWLADSRRRDPRLFALASLGVERTQLIDSDTGGTNGTFDVARADISIGWSPEPGRTYGLRYELIHQTGDPTAVMLIAPFTRNTLFFTFAIRYPDRIAGQVPPQSRTVRADRKDQTPVGAEPVVPDVLEPAQDDDAGHN